MSELYYNDNVAEVSIASYQSDVSDEMLSQWVYDKTNLTDLHYLNTNAGWIGAKTWNGVLSAAQRNLIVSNATADAWTSVPFKFTRNEYDAIELQDPYANSFTAISQIQAIR